MKITDRGWTVICILLVIAAVSLQSIVAHLHQS